MSDSSGPAAIGSCMPVASHSRATRTRVQGASKALSVAVVGRQHSKCCAAAASLSVLLTLVGCGAPAPKDYGGSWAAVNRFQNAPTEIPLSPAYIFYASPMDGTLRTMLTRWASDNGLQLSYQIGSDFTLHQPVAKVRTRDIQSAVDQLSAIYAPQGLSITTDSRQILVQAASVAAPIASGPH